MHETAIFRSACPTCSQPRLSRDLIDRDAAPTAEFVCVNSECDDFAIYRLPGETVGSHPTPRGPVPQQRRPRGS